MEHWLIRYPDHKPPLFWISKLNDIGLDKIDNGFVECAVLIYHLPEKYRLSNYDSLVKAYHAIVSGEVK